MKTYQFHKPIISPVIKIEGDHQNFESRRIKKQAAQIREASFELYEEKKLASVVEETAQGIERLWNFVYQENQYAASLTAPSAFADLGTKKKTPPVLRYGGEQLQVNEEENIIVKREGEIIAESVMQRRFPTKKYEIKIAESIPGELTCILLLFYSVKYAG